MILNDRGKAMKCKYCGELLEDGSRFCYRCGKAVELKPAKRHCGYCGAELETGAAFCWQCGKAASPAVPSETAEKVSKAPAAQNTDKAEQTGAEEKAKLKARTTALVLAAQSGDSDSFTELYRLYNQKIFALARTTVRSNADAEDVLQMTFLKAWNHLGKLKNPSAFSTWIQRITLNQCYSLLRKKHIDISIDDDDEDTEPIQPESDLMLPEVYAERSDLKERLGRIIRSLSTVQQQTVTLYYFDGLPVENIAWIMDCSVNTVKSRLFLARKSIKTEIEEQERKSGQPFYGIVGLGTIPFGKLFVEQVEANALPQSAVSKVLESITRYIVESVAKNVGQAAAGAARSAGDASAKTAANGAAKAAVRTAAKAGARTAAKAATTAVSKKIIAGIVAGVLAVGAVTGGTVAAVSAFQKQKGAAPATETLAAASADTAPQPESAFTIVTEEGLTDPFSNPELQSAYRAYLSLLEEEKEGIDNYIWQKGYTLRYDEDDRELLPLTDDLVARPVAICDVYGDDTPELIFIGDVAPGEWNVWEWGEAWYQNDSVARLHIVTYQDGKAVTLYDDDWDGWGDSWNSYHFFQTDGSKDLYATWSNGDLTFWDYVYSFTEGTDGKLHKEQVCLFLDDEDDGKLYYGGHNQRISEDEYHSMLRSFSENTTNILMYSHIGIEEFRSSVEQHGCSAMTCDEAIAYLEKQLGLNHSLATDDRSSDMPYFQTTFTASSGNIGTAAVKLKKGFDFIKSDSSLPNHELAVTAITLSAQVYNNAQGNKAEEILKGLGYDKTAFSNGDSSFAHPGVCFGFKQLESGKNLFTAVVRGTDNLADFWTDVQDGHLGMFRVSGEYIEAQLETFMKKVTGKTKDELLREENYFFFTGHSLGGAVANYLSINGDIMQFAGSDKGKIYTYTFESPHTCVNLWWTDPESESNAFNYKVDGDAVTNYPAYMGSTTYGKDIWIRVSELNDRLFLELFPDSACETLAIATSVDGHGDIYGLHDVCLDLVYVVEEAINNGSSAYKDPNSKEAMYRAYLDVLQKHEDHILRYQQDAWFDADTRPIALRNVYGDEMPELLFLESIAGDYDDEVALVIITYSDGSAQTIFSDTVCYDIIEESFFLFQLPGDDTLYMSTSAGRQDVSMDAYYAFVPGANGSMEMKMKMYLEAEFDPDSGSKNVYFCEIDGKNAKEPEFAKEEAYISNHLDCVLQGNIIPRYGYRPESIPSMTYEEATQHLKQLVANGILE